MSLQEKSHTTHHQQTSIKLPKPIILVKGSNLKKCIYCDRYFSQWNQLGGLGCTLNKQDHCSASSSPFYFITPLEIDRLETMNFPGFNKHSIVTVIQSGVPNGNPFILLSRNTGVVSSAILKDETHECYTIAHKIVARFIKFTEDEKKIN